MSIISEWVVLFIRSIPYILMVLIMKYCFDNRRLFILGNRLPGPRLWIIGTAFYFVGRKDFALLGKITELNKKYGLVSAWLGHKLYIYICTPEDAEICFTSRHLHNNSEIFKLLEPAFGKGLITANGDDWKKARKLMEPAFRSQSLEGFTDELHEKVNVLIQCLQKEVGKQSFSIYPYIKNCAFDIACGLTPMCFNAQTQGTELVEHVDRLEFYLWDRMFRIWQHFDFIYKQSKRGKDFYRRLDILRNFIDPKIKELRNKLSNEKSVSKGFPGNKATFYELIKFGGEPKFDGSRRLHFVDALEQEFSKRSIAERIIMEHLELDDAELRDHAYTMIAAGYKTTTTAISFILIMLGIHRDVQEKLYDELSTAFKGGLQEKDLHRLSYLDMVIKETLRLYPPVPHLLRKADQDVQMGKHLIPKGASVGVNIFAIHRNPKEYENPEVFNPDNFLPENTQKRHPFSFVPFGMGGRKCIGSKVAMTTLRIAVSKMLCNYKIECDLKLEDIELKDRITLQMKNNSYPLRIIKR